MLFKRKSLLFARRQNSVRKRDEIGYQFLVIIGGLCCSLSPCSAGTENLTKPTATYDSSQTIRTATSAAGSPSVPVSASASASASIPASAYQTAGVRTVMRVYDECSRSEVGFVPCLKKKAISFIDRISYIDAITVADGIRLVRARDAEIGDAQISIRSFSENELESSGPAAAPRSSEDHDHRLTIMLIERLTDFFNRHSLQVSFPKLSAEEIGRGLEEGRGKMKKMMGMMVMGMAMKMMGMVPIAMGGLYMLAGKALIISKIALLLAGIMGLKKLMSGRGGSGGSGGWSSGGGGGGGWSSGGGNGGGGGWDRRSLNEAQDMAYRGHNRLQKQRQLLQDEQPQTQRNHEDQQQNEQIQQHHHHHHQQQPNQKQQSNPKQQQNQQQSETQSVERKQQPDQRL